MENKTEESIEFVCTFYINLFVLTLATLKTQQEDYQVQNNFAIGMCFECVRFRQRLPKRPVVVYLAVDREDEGLVGVDDWLSPRFCAPCYQFDQDDAGEGVFQDGDGGVFTDADDGQSFVAEDGVVLDNVARPVRSTVTNRLGQLEGSRLELHDRLEAFVACEDSAHGKGGRGFVRSAGAAEKQNRGMGGPFLCVSYTIYLPVGKSSEQSTAPFECGERWGGGDVAQNCPATKVSLGVLSCE